MTAHRLFVSVSLLSSISMTASAQTPSPATRRAREVVGVINSATPASVRAFVDSAFGGEMRGLPMQAHIGFFMG
ncbi:MAG TPA: hypothetical protein VFZ21_23040, partial [Gemmatimonadaceae bacterium]|nr:hypothetical protein [Gemmatimonadaceae bacterium]